MSIDMEKLYRLVCDGKDADQIMSEMGIKNKGRLEQLLFRLFRDKGEVRDVSGLSEADIRNRTVTKTGINIPASLLDSKHIEGTVFRFESHDDKIVLSRINQS